MKIYLGGRFSTGTEIEQAWLDRTGCKYRCFSFANLHPEAMNYSINTIEALDVCIKNKVGIMMDSGAFSFHEMTAQTKRRSKISDSKKTVDMEELQEQFYHNYVEYVKANKKKWDFYVTLDYRMHQPTILKMQKRFVKDGLLPVPVYHGDMGLEWLLKHKEMGCNLIATGLGKSIRGIRFKGRRYYFDRVFNFAAKHDIKIHGLAVTSLGLMTAYPFHSVDSATWVRSSIYGSIAFPDREKNVIYNLHVSKRHITTGVASYNTMPQKQKDMVKETIKDFGFSLKELRSDKDGLEGRHMWNGKVFAHVFDLIDTNIQKHTEWEALI